jgi:hypothetical protein
MERRLSPAAFIVACLVFTLTFLSMSVTVPHDRYYRWQAYDNGATRKTDWIYERLHFDATPIDVALIGTSRMGGGLSGPDIEAGYCATTGRRIHVANLAVPETGRNLHFVIAREASGAKSPALTVVELNEVETRKPHNGFIFLADAKDILQAPIFINLNFFSDLLRLPGRQLQLFVASASDTPALRRHFEPTAYRGPHLDRTREIDMIDGRSVSRFVRVDESALDAAADARRDAASTMSLPRAVKSLEHRFSRIYLKRIEALAQQAKSDIAYAYLPAWRARALPTALKSDLDIKAPVLDLGGAITDDASLWFDATHVNGWGAAEMSARFADLLAEQYPQLGEEGC